VTFTIEGHADERGTREYNLALGERRANSVKDYLASLGINPARMKTISYGKERPVAIGSTQAAWGQNRRGVTRVTGAGS
jgi:peptidoglycan-associated lipoprotein